MKIVGHQARGFVAFYGFMIFILFMVEIFFISSLLESSNPNMDTDVYYILLLPLGFIVTLILAIIYDLRKPYESIGYDDQSFYIFHRKNTITIPIKDVETILSRRDRSRSMTFTSGAVIFKTDNKNYKIRNISQCEDVVSTLHKIMKESVKERFDV